MRKGEGKRKKRENGEGIAKKMRPNMEEVTKWFWPPKQREPHILWKNQKFRETLRHPSIFSDWILWLVCTLLLSLSLSLPLFSAILEKQTVPLLVIWISTFLFPHSLLPTSLSTSPPSLSLSLSLFPHFSLVPAPNSKPYCCCPQIQPFPNHPHLGSGEFSLFDSIFFSGSVFFFLSVFCGSGWWGE